MTSDPQHNAELGWQGQKAVAALLERACFGHFHGYEGHNDLHRDLMLQFKSAAPERTSLHVAVQVKTGESHGEVDSSGRHWKPTALASHHFRDWQHGNPRTMLVWFRPEPEGDGRAYWALVPRDGELRYF